MEDFEVEDNYAEDDAYDMIWDDDSHLAQYDDDPSPYNGDYSEM